MCEIYTWKYLSKKKKKKLQDKDSDRQNKNGQIFPPTKAGLLQIVPQQHTGIYYTISLRLHFKIFRNKIIKFKKMPSGKKKLFTNLRL